MKRKSVAPYRTQGIEAQPNRALWPLVAIGSSLAAGPAAALELGDLTVHSHLGQPLRASIAYALAPHEELSDLCVAATAGPVIGGMPGIGATTVSISGGRILLTGKTPIREPMMGTRVRIDCPYTPNLARDYMLFVDPAGLTAPATEQAQPAARAATPAPQPAATTRRPAAREARSPIGPATQYRVQAGDSLSGIVQRIENRKLALWPAVNAIFEANPHAFIDNDPNRLKAGSWLDIPSLDGSAPVVATPDTASEVSLQGSVYEPPVIEEPAAVEAPASETAPVETAPVETVPSETAVTTIATVAAAAATTVESPARDAAAATDPVVELPTPIAEPRPALPTTIVSTGSRDESTSLFAALVGGGLALLALLLVFGRRLRQRFGSTPVGPAAARAAAGAAAADSATDITAEQPRCDIEDDSPTDENPTLDANLFDGQGLNDGTDVDAAQDFGFAATTELDIELPFEPAASIADSKDATDILPAPDREELSSILDSEMLPEDDDYDMSVIMDVTKMPRPEDATERDLHAVALDTDDDTHEMPLDMTINNDAGIALLEQDYEEELTATQALNAEMAKAAANLRRDVDGEPGDDEATTSLPVEQEAAAEEITAEFDVTAELPLAENDETVEMPRKKADG